MQAGPELQRKVINSSVIHEIKYRTNRVTIHEGFRLSGYTIWYKDVFRLQRIQLGTVDCKKRIISHRNLRPSGLD